MRRKRLIVLTVAVEIDIFRLIFLSQSTTVCQGVLSSKTKFQKYKKHNFYAMILNRESWEKVAKSSDFDFKFWSISVDKSAIRPSKMDPQ